MSAVELGFPYGRVSVAEVDPFGAREIPQVIHVDGVLLAHDDRVAA